MMIGVCFAPSLVYRNLHDWGNKESKVMVKPYHSLEGQA